MREGGQRGLPAHERAQQGLLEECRSKGGGRRRLLGVGAHAPDGGVGHAEHVSLVLGGGAPDENFHPGLRAE